MAEANDWGPSGAIQADQGYSPVRPRLTFVDLVLQLWRAKWLMILVFLPIFALGILAALQMPKKFESTSRLYVRLSEELTIRPVFNDPNQLATPETETLIQGEIALMNSPVIAERTLSRFPLERVYPKLAEARAKALQSGEDAEAVEFEIFQESVDAFRKDFWAGSAPKATVVNVAYKHADPVIAAEILNAAIGNYIDYRTELFSKRSTDSLTGQRQKFEADLLQAENDIRTFLTSNGIGDFQSERSTAQTLYGTISGELLQVRSRALASEAQVASLTSQLATISPEKDLYIEDSSDQRLLDLQLDREQLLSRYTEDSRAVQAVDKQIEQVKAYLDAQEGKSGTVRRGANPVYENIETSLKTAEAEQRSLEGQAAALQAQLATIEARLNRIIVLEPEWNDLVRKRDLLEANVRSIAEREQQETSLQDIAAESADSIRVLEPASIPLRGSSMRFPVAVLALLFAGFTALMAGLLRALTREGFATPTSLQRTSGLQVIGVVGRR